MHFQTYLTLRVLLITTELVSPLYIKAAGEIMQIENLQHELEIANSFPPDLWGYVRPCEVLSMDVTINLKSSIAPLAPGDKTYS